VSFTVEKLPNHPVVVQTLGKDFSHAAEGIRGMEQATHLLDQQSHPVFFIWNLSDVSLSLDDIIAGAGLATKQAKFFQHPNIREAIVITKSRMLELASKGMDSPIFGNIKMRIFKTLDEALAYIEQAAYR